VNSVNDNGSLIWNANGTLKTLTVADSLAGTNDSQTCNYYYDDLRRLGGKDSNGYSVDCSTTWSQLFTFDPFGNISKSGSGGFAPTYSASTNQFTTIPGIVSPYYDANGNLIKDNLNTYAWDPNWGNPATINSSTNLIYDANGLMVEQQTGSTYTQMLYSPVGKTAIMNGQTLTKGFVNLPGGGTAIYTSTGLAYYRHADWLGSSRLTSTAARTVYSASAYAPFGEQYGKSGTVDASFTGQDDDTISSLYDFTFREHSPSQGRWISPDPAGLGAADPTNPQSWNRYAYVANLPLQYIDPVGLFAKDCEWYAGTAGCVPCTNCGAPPPPGGGGGGGGGDGGGGDGGFGNCSVFAPGCPSAPSGMFGGDNTYDMSGGISMSGPLWAIDAAAEGGWSSLLADEIANDTGLGSPAPLSPLSWWQMLLVGPPIVFKNPAVPAPTPLQPPGTKLNPCPPILKMIGACPTGG
jgi:RHS repeat-associated protein